ncbi:MAG: hypothetical protein ACOC83_03840 [Gemmatimonadota bacterium]
MRDPDAPSSPPGGEGRLGRRSRLLMGTLALALFLFGLRLMAGAAGELAPGLGGRPPTFLEGPVSALAAGWLLTYVLFNGSLAAAAALTFAGAGLLTDAEFLAMLGGSRLGSASFLLLLGGLDFLRRRGASLRGASELGLLTFVVTHSVYVPATVLALWAGPRAAGRVGELVPLPSVELPLLDLLPALADHALGRLGPVPALVLSLLLLAAAFQILDRLVSELDADRVRARYLARLGRPWIAFGLGASATALTGSVAFSVGAVVPPYNRGMVRRKEAVPYLLGANVGTLSDTLAVAVLLGTPGGIGAVVMLGLVAAVLSVAAQLAFDRYYAAVDRGLEVVLASRLAAAGFVASLVVVPVLLLFWG